MESNNEYKTFMFDYFFLICIFIISQVIDYTGKGNPYKNLSQKEKDEKLLEICDKWYSKSDDNDNYETKAGLKPSYYNLMYALSYSNNVSYFKKLIPYVDLKNGDDNYKHDFLSFCISNSYEFDFNQSSLLISTLLENGFTADTLIYDKKREKESPNKKFLKADGCS